MARLEREVFERLVLDHHAAVYRSAMRVLCDRGAAEDATQDVFLRVLTGKLPLPDSESPRPSLCWLATRLACNELRGSRRREFAHRRADAHHRSRNSMNSESPAELADDIEQQRRVRALVHDLPEDLRVPLLLRFEDGLTFSAIGSALHVSESTAHERVQRALERLRARCQRVAPGLVAVDWSAALPPLLAADPVEPAPAGLVNRLLNLWPSAAASSVVLVKLAGVALLLAGIAVAAVSIGGADDGPPPPAAGEVARAHVTTDGERPLDALPGRVPAGEAIAPPEPRPRDEYVTFSGTVVDATNAPVEGARVVAVAAGGYKPFEIAKTSTDGAGAFELLVSRQARPVPAKKTRVSVFDGPLRVWESDVLSLPGDRDAVDLPIVLPREAGLESERYSLAVAVRDDSGAPVADARVVLYPDPALLPAGQPAPWIGTGPGDCEGRTDPRGVAHLQGRVPGAKVVFVDGRPLGLRTDLQPVAVSGGGRHRHEVQLDEGARIDVRITTVDGGVPAWANAWLIDETDRIHHPGKMNGSGAIRFSHLDRGPFTLRVTSNPWSPARLTGLRPSSEIVSVRLKDQSDERDVGDHEAEVHGRLIDAATGELVRFEDVCVEVREVRPGPSTLTLDRAVPPRPVQRMLDERKYERFHLTGLAAGEHAVVVDVPGYCQTVAVVSLTERQVRLGLEIELRRGVVVRGRVVDAAGEPVADALVFPAGVGAGADAHVEALRRSAALGDAPRWAFDLPCSVRSDEHGRFALERVPPLQQLRLIALTSSAVGEAASTAFQPGEERGGFELHLR